MNTQLAISSSFKTAPDYSVSKKSTQGIRIAIQKSGRLSDQSSDLLSRCGLRLSQSRDKLVRHGINMPIDLLLVRDDDIPTLMRQGTCDLAIVGQNVAREYELECKTNKIACGYEQVIPLNFSQCRLSIAVPEDFAYTSVEDLSQKRIATSYPNILKDYLDKRSIDCEIVCLSGSVEIATSLDTADAICDLVSSGATLQANHLREVETLLSSCAGLYRNTGPMSDEKQQIIDLLLPRIQGVLQVKESKYVMLHAPRSAIEEIKSLLPGAESPTIMPLDLDSGKVAIHVVCREAVFWEHLEALKAVGASAVLVLPIEKMML